MPDEYSWIFFVFYLANCSFLMSSALSFGTDLVE